MTQAIIRDISGVVDQIKQFTDAFNGIVDKIADLTKFDPATQTSGLLLGDDTVRVDLPTDVFDTSHYFLARGVSLQHFNKQKPNPTQAGAFAVNWPEQFQRSQNVY